MNLPVLQFTPKPTSVFAAKAPNLQTTPMSVTEIGEACVRCRQCMTDCRFLSKHGPPGELASRYNMEGKELRDLAFSCSLCNLCHEKCPLDLEPARMFLDLRREAIRSGEGNYPAHKGLLNFERFGASNVFRYLFLPPGCTSLFFPGCSLPGSRPAHALKLYRTLQKHEPTMGIMLDCCNKPSHDLGRQHFFMKRFLAREGLFTSKGITKIITACPSCYQALSTYSQNIAISTAYTELAGHDDLPVNDSLLQTTYTIHDPCATRFEVDIHQAIRELLGSLEIHFTEMPHNRETTLCCGEGGGVGCIQRSFATEWRAKRYRETDNRPLVTYCTGCITMLQQHGQVEHILDLIFPELKAPKRFPRPLASMSSWFNRLMFKAQLIARK